VSTKNPFAATAKRVPGEPRLVACPTCGASVPWIPERRYRPFCTERCKLIDLGQWASEQYRVAGADIAPESDKSGAESQ